MAYRSNKKDAPKVVYIVEVIQTLSDGRSNCSYRLFENRPSALGFATKTNKNVNRYNFKAFVYEGAIGEWTPLPQYVVAVTEHALQVLGGTTVV